MGGGESVESFLRQLNYEQAERAAAAAQQAAVFQRQLESARRELAAVRASRNLVVADMARTMAHEKETAVRRTSELLGVERIRTGALTETLTDIAKAMEEIADIAGLSYSHRPRLLLQCAVANSDNADAGAQQSLSVLVPDVLVSAVRDALGDCKKLQRQSIDLETSRDAALESQRAAEAKLASRAASAARRGSKELSVARRKSSAQQLALQQLALSLDPAVGSVTDRGSVEKPAMSEIEQVGVALRQSAASEARLRQQLEARQRLSLGSACVIFFALLFSSPLAILALLLATLVIAVDGFLESSFMSWLLRRKPKPSTPALRCVLTNVRGERGGTRLPVILRVGCIL
jgi:hypothetical protein